MNQKTKDFSNKFNFLEDKKLLLLSDTGNPYKHIIEFIPELKKSKIYIYVSPASTSRFIQLFIKQKLNRKVSIIKDKNFKLFFSAEINNYIICIFFGSKKTKETLLLRRLTRHMLLKYNNIIVITEKGVDYDEDYTL
jgi:hypothetical protein